MDGVSRMFRAFAMADIPEGLAKGDPDYEVYEQTLCTRTRYGAGCLGQVGDPHKVPQVGAVPPVVRAVGEDADGAGGRAHPRQASAGPLYFKR